MSAIIEPHTLFSLGPVIVSKGQVSGVEHRTNYSAYISIFHLAPPRRARQIWENVLRDEAPERSLESGYKGIGTAQDVVEPRTT